MAANHIMERTGVPPNTWLLCLVYVCFLLNHTYNTGIGDVPLNCLTGSPVDISVLLKFFFGSMSTTSKWILSLGHIVSISEHCGRMLTWKILTNNNQKIIYCLLVCPFSNKDQGICCHYWPHHKIQTSRCLWFDQPWHNYTLWWSSWCTITCFQPWISDWMHISYGS